MKELVLQKIHALFDRLVEPELRWTINALNLVQAIDLSEDLHSALVVVHLITEDQEQITLFKNTVIEELRDLGIKQPVVITGRVNIATEGIQGVQHILCVASGKGGVGKSTLAVQLALALAKQTTVGLLDADMYGASLPTLLNCSKKPEVLPNEYLKPVLAHGIPTMSLGYLIEPTMAVDWRGTLASGTLLQFIEKTLWGSLEVLVVDLPPGTSDIHLSLAHRLKAHVVLVSTAERIVQADVLRSLHFYQQREVPILGIIENFAQKSALGTGQFTELYNTSVPAPLLAQVEYSPEVVQANHHGIPLMISQPEHPFSMTLHALANTLLQKLRQQVTGPVDILAKSC